MQSLEDKLRRDQLSRITATTGHMPGDWEDVEEQECLARGIKFAGGANTMRVKRLDGIRARFSPLEPGTDRIHIRLDHDTQREFWAELSFSLGQLREWLAAEGCHMQWRMTTTVDNEHATTTTI